MKRLTLLVALVALAAYAPNLGNGFAMDDRYNVVEHLEIRSLVNVPSFFGHAWGATAASSFDQRINQDYWRPLSTTSLALDYAVYGLRPWGFHLTNDLLHALVSAILALLIWRLTGSAAGAATAGLFFALHPVHTEAVNLVTYRTELLATLFVVLAALVHVRSRSWATAAGIAALYAAGLASKETAVTLPGWLFVLDVALGRLERRDVLRLYLPLAAVLAGYLALRGALLTGTAMPFYGELPASLVVASVMRVYLLYARLLVWPWPLTPFYDWSVLPPATSWDGEALAGLALLLGTPLAVVALRRVPLVAAGLALWLLGLVPFSHLAALPVGAAERFLYLPSVGLALAAGISVCRLPRRVAMAIAGAACVLMAAGTVLREPAWASDLTLQEQAARDFPRSFNAHHALGQLYLERERAEDAADAFYAADELLPDFPPNVAWLAKALVAAGRTLEAHGVVERAIARRGPDPALLEALTSLASPPGRR